MDCKKAGQLLAGLRKEKKMTQKNLADMLGISDKTISKWERGQGFPDTSLLHSLSEALGVNIDKIILGDLNTDKSKGGNMKRIKFYICKDCGNTIADTGNADVSCCGRKLSHMELGDSGENFEISISEVEHDYYLNMDHEMTKGHYISFIAYVSYDRMLLVKLYPEQNAEVRLPIMSSGKLFTCCSQHGLKEYRFKELVQSQRNK